MDRTFYEGWLIKSPPTKRIWRARWRRRWFTLKQGEIPEQFCLEYYTDHNCRKLKGVIDLEQCEQVDCGLRLENRKQKFQYMFDIKTPKRTYYLAAETETDMRDWVNCICQVCHLHDTKQSNELPLGRVTAIGDENRTQNTTSSGAHSNSTNNTTTTSLHSSTGGGGLGATSILRRPAVIDQQPQSATVSGINNNADSVYVNTDYNNRETILCESSLEQQQLLSAAQQQPPPSPATALYLNHSALIQAAVEQQQQAARLAVNANGVVRKLPEHLVLTQQTLSEAAAQSHASVQASPALSTASGPYIPISECFSGSPKFLLEGNASGPPLNNLDPKFYDTPRSHNNIGLNLTNDQSYSPKITNCSLQQLANGGSSSKIQQRNQRSDSDSESVFTDDDEWAHPLPLRENVDRSTRPSDSSIENESFVLTYSQRFSKMPEDATPTEAGGAGTEAIKATTKMAPPPLTLKKSDKNPTLNKLATVLKNKNNLILDLKDSEPVRDLPQFSDTENTSPAIVAQRRAHAYSALIEESYDIPRSHQLPYYNMNQLMTDRPVTSPHNTNPIAASTPNLTADVDNTSIPSPKSISSVCGAGGGANSPSTACTLPRPHCYTNAAPIQMEGNVFRYDFVEQANCPPVNRKLKPKMASMPESRKSTLEDKPPEEFPAKPPIAAVGQLSNKLGAAQLHQSCAPPSVDRKCKPNAYKLGSSATMSPATRRSSGTALSMVLSPDTDVHLATVGSSFLHESLTLPRQPHRPHPNSPGSMSVQHQRTASAAAAMTMHATTVVQKPLHPPAFPQVEHKLQYFDLDVANKPPLLNRQSISVGNLYAQGASSSSTSARLNSMDVGAARAPPQSSGVVYNSVDFVKTEAFKRIREERNKESIENNSATSNK